MAEIKPKSPAEPRMAIRDADLRQAIHANSAPPGTRLWKLLRELQRRRDREGDGRQEGGSR